MLRWYIQHHLPARDPAVEQRYGDKYEQLARRSHQVQGGFDQSSLMRYLVRQSLPDFEAALQLEHVLATDKSALAYHLAQPYDRLGQNRRVLALYELALEIYQELGDVRSVAVTQHAMADVLRQQGKPQEAMSLYEQSLRTMQELGDLRGVAVTQANYCQFLLQQGEHQRGLLMAWQAYTSLYQHRYDYDAGVMLQILVSIKEEKLGPERFDDIWKQVIHEPQPDWLRKVKATGPKRQGRISPEQLKVIAANTITVMTQMPEKQDEWRETIAHALQQAQDDNRTQDAEFFTAILAVLSGQAPTLSEEHAYAEALYEIQAAIAAGGSEYEEGTVNISAEALQAIRDFVNAGDWDASREVVQAQQALLFQPEVEGVFEQNIANARMNGQQRAVEILEMHLALLRQCKAIGIVEAFRQLEEVRERAEEAENVEAKDEDDLPFDANLVTRSVEALLGSAQERMAHMQYLSELASETTDEELKALINALQMALVGGDLSQLGRNLSGVYKQAWETITAIVEAGGVDPRLFD